MEKKLAALREGDERAALEIAWLTLEQPDVAAPYIPDLVAFLENEEVETTQTARQAVAAGLSFLTPHFPDHIAAQISSLIPMLRDEEVNREVVTALMSIAFLRPGAVMPFVPVLVRIHAEEIEDGVKLRVARILEFLRLNELVAVLCQGFAEQN